MCERSTRCSLPQHRGATGSTTLTRNVPAAEGAREMSRSEWILLALLTASIFLNYVDRSNLSVAAPLLEKELSLSPAKLGSLLGSFFWTYALLQLFGIAGWFADRFPV